MKNVYSPIPCSLYCSQNLFVMFVITPRGRTGIVDVANNQLQHICIRVHDNGTDACRCFAKKTPEKLKLKTKTKTKNRNTTFTFWEIERERGKKTELPKKQQSNAQLEYMKRRCRLNIWDYHDRSKHDGNWFLSSLTHINTCKKKVLRFLL